MDTVFYKGKKYSGIRVPRSSQIKLYSAERHYKGRYIITVKESELDGRDKKEEVQHREN